MLNLFYFDWWQKWKQNRKKIEIFITITFLDALFAELSMNVVHVELKCFLLSRINYSILIDYSYMAFDCENKRNVFYQLISKDMEITPGWNFSWFYYVFCLFLPFISFCVIRNSFFVIGNCRSETHTRTCQNHFINGRIALVTFFKDFPCIFAFVFANEKKYQKKTITLWQSPVKEEFISVEWHSAKRFIILFA